MLRVEGQRDEGREVSPRGPGGSESLARQRVSARCSRPESEAGHTVSTSCYYETSSEVHASPTPVLSTGLYITCGRYKRADEAQGREV